MEVYNENKVLQGISDTTLSKSLFFSYLYILGVQYFLYDGLCFRVDRNRGLFYLKKCNLSEWMMTSLLIDPSMG